MVLNSGYLELFLKVVGGVLVGLRVYRVFRLRVYKVLRGWGFRVCIGF